MEHLVLSATYCLETATQEVEQTDGGYKQILHCPHHRGANDGENVLGFMCTSNIGALTDILSVPIVCNSVIIGLLEYSRGGGKKIICSNYCCS